VDEVDVLPIDLGGEVLELVERGFVGTPVVTCLPTVRKIPESR
jgi:hypothetical protein